MPWLLTSLDTFTVSLCSFCHRETDRFLSDSGVEHVQHNQDQMRFRRAAFYSQLKAKVGNILAKVTTLCLNLNIDDAPIASRSHTHPSHSQTARLLFTSLSLDIPFPRYT